MGSGVWWERGEERVEWGVVGGGKSEIEPLEMAVCIVSSKQTESGQLLEALHREQLL